MSSSVTAVASAMTTCRPHTPGAAVDRPLPWRHARARDRERRRPRSRVRRAPPAPARLPVHRGPAGAPRGLAGARRRRSGADAGVGVERLPAGDGGARGRRGGVRARGRAPRRPAAGHLLRGPGAVARARRHGQPRRRRPRSGGTTWPSTAPPIAAGPWMEWHIDVFTPPEGFAVRRHDRPSARSSSPAGAAWRPSSTPRPRRRSCAAGSPRAAPTSYASVAGTRRAPRRDPCQRGAQPPGGRRARRLVPRRHRRRPPQV